MKKLLIPILLLGLVSCGGKHRGSSSGTSSGSGQDSGYEMTKEFFEHEFDPYTIAFESNYTVAMNENGSLIRTIDFDHGKFMIDKTYIYDCKYDQKTNTVSGYGYYQGDINYQFDQTPLNDFYRFWFGSYQTLFSLPYQAFEYDENNKQYVCSNVSVGSYVITSGIIKVYNNKPLFAEFAYDNNVYSFTLTNHGNVNITVPVSPYLTTKEVFEYEFNPFTVAFLSNYECQMSMFGSTQTTLFDNGKAIAGGNNYFKNTYNDTLNKVYMDVYYNAGVYHEQREMTLEEFYDFWFGNAIIFFELGNHYDDFKYDYRNKQYKCTNITLSSGAVVTYGIVKSYNNKPTYLECVIDGAVYSLSFSRHGEISIDFPPTNA